MNSKEISNEEALSEIQKLAKGDTKARLNEQLKDQVISPIVLAKAIGVRPQMIYNYIRDGKIEATFNNSQKKVIPLERALSFVAIRLQKQAAKKAAEELATKATNL